MTSHLYWLGGSPCAGKSSMAALLAQTYDLRVYAVDEALPRQLAQLTPAMQPVLYKWTHTPWDALWMQPPAVLLDEAIAAYREHCRLVVAEIGAEAATLRPVLVEGTCLLPECVAPHLPARPMGTRHWARHGLWVVPTAAFQRDHYPRRGPLVQSILDQCRDPDQALTNWMDRDVAFGRWVAAEATQRGYRVLVVDGSRTVADHAAQVAAHFGWRAEHHEESHVA